MLSYYLKGAEHVHKRFCLLWSAGMLNINGRRRSVFERGLKCFALSLALGAACLLTPALADEGDKPTVTLTVSAAVYQNTSQYDSLKPYEAYTQGKAALENGDASGYALLESSARRGCNQAKMLLAKYFLPADHPLNAAGKTSVELEGKSLDGKERMLRYLTWMNSAAENGSSTAAKELADLYREGKYVGKDAGQIFKYTKLAALAKEPEYMYRLGTYYAQGLGCQKDRAAAVKWIKNAAHAGSAEAKQWIADRRGGYEPVKGMVIPYGEKSSRMVIFTDDADYEVLIPSLSTLKFGDSLDVLRQRYAETIAVEERRNARAGYRGPRLEPYFDVRHSGGAVEASYCYEYGWIRYYLSDEGIFKVILHENFSAMPGRDMNRPRAQKYISRLRSEIIEAGYSYPSVDTPLRCEWHTNGVHVNLHSGEWYMVDLEMKADSLNSWRKPKVSGWEDLL